MATKKYKPTSAGSRTRSVLDFSQVNNSEIPKHLRGHLKQAAGRNNEGKITVRHRGGKNKRIYRVIDFSRIKRDVPGVVHSIQYDPNRTAFIALINYVDGDKRYILTPIKLAVGDNVMAGRKADIKPGCALPLSCIPDGTIIHNLELSVGRGAQIARSAGVFAVLQAKSKKYATVKLPSGEVRLINLECYATIGQVGNIEHRNTRLGKAGIMRKLGFRPTVRGSAMNACDHPHGGGEGKAPIGHASPMSKWGKPTLGYKTRNKRKNSSRFIVRRSK